MRKGIILGCLLSFLCLGLAYRPVLAQEKHLGHEHVSSTEIMCPDCKVKTTAIKKGGGITLEKEMVCSECKGKGTALDPHVCEKCGGEVVLCPKCAAVVAKVAKPVEMKCPDCKETVTAIKKGGGVTLVKEMECPNCKTKIGELGVFACEKCGKDILACPICREHAAAEISPVKAVEFHCPACGEKVTAIKKGGGVTLEKTHICGQCKKPISEAELHTCEKCGKDLLLCPHCQQPL